MMNLKDYQKECYDAHSEMVGSSEYTDKPHWTRKGVERCFLSRCSSWLRDPVLSILNCVNFSSLEFRFQNSGN